MGRFWKHKRVGLALGSGGALLFTGAMLVGMALFALWRRR